MSNEEINLKKFELYKNRAIEECQNLSYSEKTEGLWSEPEIMDYFIHTSSDEPNKYFALAVKEILSNLSNKKILCVGGGTGKLGRSILEIYPDSHITEIDSSKEMTVQANILANKKGINNNFISIEANAKSLPFKDGEYDYAIAYGVFRYIESNDYEKVISEIGRVTNYNFIISEPLLKDLIYSLKNKINNHKSAIKETEVSMFRMSLFYMLFKEYKRNINFKLLVDNETTLKINFIKILTSIAGMTTGILYELRVSN